MRLRSLCKSKIHHATVTDASLHYIGSITIDADLLDLVDIVPGEQVSIWNITNGERFETYAIAGDRGKGSIIINGAGARRCAIGDKVIIAAFLLTDEVIEPKMIQVDGTNRFKAWLNKL